MRRKCVGYARVSTDDQGELSLLNQAEKIRAYADAKGLEVIGVYDDKETGTSIDKRGGAKEVMDLVLRRGVDAVVVYKLDRMFRNTQEALAAINEMRWHDVAFHSVLESIDTHSALGKFFFTIMAALAEMEAGLISERTTDVLRSKKRRGELYGPVPYGYENHGGILRKHAGEQRVLAAMRRMRARGGSFRQIADSLNKKGIPAKYSGKWFASSVRSVLQPKEIGGGG